MNTSNGSVEFGRETICYEVQFLTTRRTLGIEVHPNLQVLVRAPTDCDPAIIAAKVQRRASWISKPFSRYCLPR